MEKFLTLTWFRRVVQLFFFVIMVYGSLFMTTFYSEDKFTNALPALSCAYDNQSGDYCTLIPLQHQLDHRKHYQSSHLMPGSHQHLHPDLRMQRLDS